MADETFTQEQLDAAIAKAIGPLNDKIEAAEGKNAGLLDDLKKAQREARAAKDIKPEDLHAAEEARDKAEAKATDLEKQVKALTGERDKAVKSLETESAFTQKLLISDGLKTALIANGVKDEDFIDSLTAKFASTASVKIDGDKREALLGDKPLGDAIKEWAGSDAGKKFVAAAINGGGGASGGDSKGGGGKTMTREAFEAADGPAKVAFAKEGGKVVDAAA